MDDPVTNMSLPPADQDEPVVKVGLKVAGVTAVVLLVLFGLYWGGKKLLLTPGAEEEDKETIPVQVRLDCPPEQVYTDLESALKNTDTVCELDLSGGSITKLGKEIGSLKNLAILDVSDNQLTEISGDIGLLKSLTKLDVSGNQMAYIPTQVSWLIELREFDFSYNLMTKFPDWVGYMKNLEVLNLEGNQLTEIHRNIGAPNLKKLIVRGNKISLVPDQILYAKNLVVLDLRNNQLSSLPLSEFRSIISLQNLQRLELGGNPLPAEEVDRMRKLLPNATVNF